MDPVFWSVTFKMPTTTFLCPNGTRFARAISGPTPSNAPRNDVAPLKTIKYRAIKSTGTLIVNMLQDGS
jgi:hypothetical protein